jgi:hypothetical protein
MASRRRSWPLTFEQVERAQEYERVLTPAPPPRHSQPALERVLMKRAVVSAFGQTGHRANTVEGPTLTPFRTISDLREFDKAKP